MNKIFKVVWSKTKECYVVVSEVAKNNSGKKKVLASVLAALAVVGAGAGVSVQAADMNTDTSANTAKQINIWANTKYKGNPAAGGSNAAGTGTANSNNVRPSDYGDEISLAIGNYNVVSSTDTKSPASGGSSYAIGNGNQLKGNRNIAVGTNNKTYGDDSIAMGNQSISGTGHSIAIGSISGNKQTVAYGSQNPSETGPSAFGFALAIGAGAQADGRANSTSGGIAIGQEVTATNTNSIVIGQTSEASGSHAITIGRGSSATSTGAMAFGYSTNATGPASLAIGRQTNAKAYKSVAIGPDSIVNAQRTSSSYEFSGSNGTPSPAGYKTETITVNSGSAPASGPVAGNYYNAGSAVAIGDSASVSDASSGAVVVGPNAKTNGNAHYSVVLGSGSHADASDGFVAGHGSYVESRESIAMGSGANVSGNENIRSQAIGFGATVTGTGAYDATAIGSTAQVSGVQGGVALGSGSLLSRTTNSNENAGWNSKSLNGTAIRNRAYTADLTGNNNQWDSGSINTGAVSVGNDTQKRQIINVAAGSQDTDAVNVAQLKNVGVRVGADTNTATIGTNKVAADFLAYNGQLNIKGDNNRVTTVSENDVNGKDANVNVKFDYDGLVKAKTGSAVTVDQKTDGNGKTYFEIDAAAASKTVLADGKNTTVTGAGTTASPYKVNVEGALTGISSITNNGGGKIEFTTGGTTISGGPVNVSNNKITGVANGDVNATSTDAVNGSQLYAVKAAERHIKPTTTGSEYTVDSNGDVTMTYLDGNNNAVAGEKAVIKGIAKQDLSNITNEGKKEITKLGTIVKAGDNVNVSESSDATTGRTTYTVSAVTPAVYTKADGTKVYKRPDGTFTTNQNLAAGNNVDKGDVITSFMDGNGNTTGGNMVINNVGSAIDKTGTSTGDTFLTKLNTAATNTPNAAVNVRDLKTTSDALVDKGLKFTGNNTGTENTHKLGSLVKVQGEGVAATDVPSFASAAGNIAVVANGTDTLEFKLNKNLKGINSVSNGSSSITLNSNPGGTNNTPAVSITGGNVDVGGNNITNLKSGGDTDSNAANIGDVKKIASDTDTHIKPGTYTVAADKTVTMTYVNGKGETVKANGQDVVAKIDLSGLPTGGTSSTEKVKKAANGANDTNIAEVNPQTGDIYGAADATYEVSVSRNAVKDAAREAVTVNNGGTTTGGTYTADADNPISVKPTKDDNNHNTSYAVTFDGNKAAKQIPLTYKATNNGTTTADQTVKLDKGLNFTGGDYTTASVGADGKVTFDVNLGTTPTVTDGKPGVPGQAGAAGKDGIATVKTVVDTINNSGWKANAKANGGKLDGTATATIVKPGNTVNYAAGNNLIVKQELETDASNALTGNQTYTYSLNKDIDLTNAGSLTVGDTTVNNGGITIKAPTPAAGTTATTTDVKLTNTGLDNGGNKIVNVAEGKADTDAVNVKQLKDAKTVLADGKNTKKSGTGTAADPYKVNVEGDLTGISSITNDGTNNGKISFGPNKTVTVDGDHSITLNASTGKIGGLQNKTFDPTNFTSGQAATEDQLKSVHDTLKADELHIAPTTGATNTVAEYTVDANNKVTLTYQDGNGTAKTGPKAVIDLSALANKITSGYTFSANATANGGTVANDTTTNPATATAVANGGTINYAAGKNLTVKQDIDVANKTQTYTYSLDKDINVETVTVTGQNGKDGKIGIDGKDGVDGLNGTNRVDIHVEKGAKGVDGTDGHDGVNGHNGKDGMTRIVYEDKGGKQEVATLNDGMKYAGDDAQGTDKTKVIAKKLNETLDIIGGANKADLTTDNIGVNNDGNGKLLVQLSKKLKGLDSVQTKTVELGDHTTPGGTTNITYNAGDKRIEYTTPGTTDTKKVATTDDIWTIQGNGTDVAPVNGKVNVKAGDNVVIKTPTTADGSMTISAVTSAVYTKADGTKVYKIIDPTTGAVTWNTKADGTGTPVNASDVIVSFQDADGNTTGGGSIVNNVGSAIDKTGTSTGNAFLTKLDTAANATPNAAVNVKDLKNTSDALINKGLNFTGNNDATINAHKLGSLVKVQGEGVAATDVPSFASAAGNIAVVANSTDTLEIKLNKNLKGINSVSNGSSSITLNSNPGGTNNTPAVQITGGNLSMGDGTANGNNKIVNLAPGTADTDAVNVKQLKAAKTVVEAGTNVTVNKTTGANGEDVYTISAAGGGTGTASSWNVKSTGNTDPASETATKNISDGKTVEMAAGKNLTVKQTSDANGAKVEFALNKDLSNLDKIVVNGNDGATGQAGVSIVGPKGANGVDGNDGKVGIAGKDGKDAVSISGKDGVGHIGLQGPKGTPGTPGADGASLDISTDHGTQTLVKPEANNGNKSERIVYVPKDKDGNPLKDTDGNTIKREVATMDDGLKFAGDDGQANQDTNPNVIKKQLNNVVDIIGGADKTKLTDNNIGVNNDNGKLKVQLSKEIDLTPSGKLTIGDTTVNTGGLTITGGPSVKKDGIDAGGKKITHVAPGTDGTDAVNVNQLNQAIAGASSTESVVKKTLTGDTNLADITVADNKSTGDKGAKYEVAVSKNAVKDAAKEAVKVTSVSPAITVTPDTSVAHETTYKVGFDGAEAAKSIPLTYKANGNGTQTVTLDKGLDFKNGTNTTARIAANGQVFYDVNPNLQNISSISGSTTGNGPRISFNNAGSNSTVNIDGGNLNMGGNKITNLAPGKDKTDAATVGQLTKVTSNNHSVVINKTTDADGAPVYDLAVTGTPGAPAADPRVDMLGEEIGRVGAQGAALSALKPIQYDPLEPTQIMAGYGNYRGNSALALGVAHYKNESTLIHGGVSWAGGSSHMMANAGVTWKVGNRDSEAAVADRYRKGPISSAYAMQQEMASVKAQNAGLKTEVSDLKAENEQMKAQIAAMMAKLGM